jgi:hypothetical protein
MLLACSKKDNSTPAVTYIDATGTWSVQSIKSKGNGIDWEYNATDVPCLADNKYEFKSGGAGRFYFAGTDSCYVYNNGSDYAVAGIPGTDNPLTWHQNKDTVFIVYTGNYRDTGIVSSINGKNYLTIAQHDSNGYINTNINTK